MTALRLFVVGSEGQVARSLREGALATPDIIVGQSTRPAVDLTRPGTILPAMEAFGPDLVVNAAAYTAVDRAESEPDLAFAINRDGAGAVAAAASRLGAPLVHLSTDYVFDGAKTSAYVETDPTGPQTVYGRSKLAGEQAVADAAPRHIILRTSWVFAPFGGNFVRTMLRLAASQERLRVVDDQIGCPTYAPDIAAAILAIGRSIAADGWRSDRAGVTHIAGPDAMSWCAFARKIVGEAARSGGRCVPVDAIATADYPTAAQRPANSRLATGRLEALFGLRLPPLALSLADCLTRLRETAGDQT
jgi:dTDP-4-dehydrorhamnose reductase